MRAYRRSSRTWSSACTARVKSGLSGWAGARQPVWVSRHGRVRPGPPPASSTKPYLASWRRWNEQVVGDSPRDRKSTRLNSSHSSISYAVFCLKKKKPSFLHLFEEPCFCWSKHVAGDLTAIDVPGYHSTLLQ